MLTHEIIEGRVFVQEGEPVELKVRAPGATGYLWSLNCDTQQIEVVDHRRVPNVRTFGGRGEESFIVRLLKGNRAELQFTLKAPWEAEPQECRKVILQTEEDH